ncbi:MAG: hypothetical protein HC941_18910 [Microcoleus sp. SU_5_3]|nr:hypothetical protein [Microcoleus sp. SU_5_3]
MNFASVSSSGSVRQNFAHTIASNQARYMELENLSYPNSQKFYNSQFS